MKPKSVLSPIAISLGLVSFNVAAEELHDWSGLYAGGMIGYSNTKASTKADSNEFKGDVYNSINSLNWSIASPGTGVSKSFDLPLFPNASSHNDTNLQGTVLIGKNIQSDHIVFGGEFRASFGDFGASSSTTNSGVGSVTGYDHEGIGNTLRLTNVNGVISGLPVTLTSAFAEFDASYEQQISQKNEVKSDNAISLVGRLGYAEGAFLWYVLGGVNLANVKAKTRTTIVESANGSLDESNTFWNNPNVVTATHGFSGSQTYIFSGDHSKNMVGYTLGGGVEWAIDDKLTLRVEGEYHDLGSISVTGTSTQTSASYKVKQDITGYSLATGLIHRF